MEGSGRGVCILRRWVALILSPTRVYDLRVNRRNRYVIGNRKNQMRRAADASGFAFLQPPVDAAMATRMSDGTNDPHSSYCCCPFWSLESSAAASTS